MDALRCYKTLPVWDAQGLPEAFQRNHNTKAGTWARLTILSGTLDFALTDEQGAVLRTLHCSVAQQPPLIEPQQWHRIAGFSPDVQCQLAFLCEPAEYLSKKYRLTPTHSEVLAAERYLPAGVCRVLDLGCGKGRNALYLGMQGHDVAAWDKDVAGLDQLREMAQQESCPNVVTQQVDLGAADLALGGPYDFILSTVVMMFLPSGAVVPLVRRMQAATAPGGLNLIVAAMDTPDCPCPVPFPFTFKPGELSGLYGGGDSHDADCAAWEILKSNEEMGILHRKDEQGNRIQLRFATLLARRLPV